MLAILSPSKTMDFEDALSCKKFTQPELLKDTVKLSKGLKTLSTKKIASLMSLSDKLAALNTERFKKFKTPFTEKNARQALLAFRGDVYQGFDLENYSQSDFTAAQKQIRILSGFYGLLRPLDLIQPYRLEMKTKFGVEGAKNLYEFWDSRVTDLLNHELKDTKSKYLINLASNEYYKVLQPKAIDTPIITPVFKEKKGSTTKVVALFAKQARGTMANFIVKNRLKHPEDLKDFREDGYRYQKSLSKDGEMVFVRGK